MFVILNKYLDLLNSVFLKKIIKKLKKHNGDWGLGIGD